MKQKEYQTPELRRYGGFEELTQQSRGSTGSISIDPLGPLPVDSECCVS
jgi:hypothetical protein